MAVNVSINKVMNAQLDFLKHLYNLKDLRLHTSNTSASDLLELITKDGRMASFHVPPSAGLHDIQRLIESLNLSRFTENVIDMRMNSIEGIPDFLALIKRAKEDRRHTDEAVVTRDQFNILMADADSANAAQHTKDVVLFGHKLRVENASH